jgi:predicted histone-like DNA-binding protein
MSIGLKKVSRANPLDRSQNKWYLTQASKGYVGTKEIADDIAARSSLTPGDVRNVLDNLGDVLRQHLQAGYSVRLEDFGAFRVSVTSEGLDTAEALSARNVKAIKLVFQASPELKDGLANTPVEVAS